ncbi:hypothetical protein [Bradyrhizobium sp. USDA 4454]
MKKSRCRVWKLSISRSNGFRQQTVAPGRVGSSNVVDNSLGGMSQEFRAVLAGIERRPVCLNRPCELGFQNQQSRRTSSSAEPSRHHQRLDRATTGPMNDSGHLDFGRVVVGAGFIAVSLRERAVGSR